jgi:hypothetical protein
MGDAFRTKGTSISIALREPSEGRKLLGHGSTKGYIVDPDYTPTVQVPTDVEFPSTRKQTAKLAHRFDQDIANCQTSPRRTPHRLLECCEMITTLLIVTLYFGIAFALCLHISETYVQSSGTIWAMAASFLAITLFRLVTVMCFGGCIFLNEYAEDSGMKNKGGVPINAPLPRDGLIYSSLMAAAAGGLWYYLDRMYSADGGSLVGLTPQFLDYTWILLILLGAHVLKYTCEVTNMVDAWAWTTTKGDLSDFRKLCVPLQDGDASKYTYNGHWKLLIVGTRAFQTPLQYNAFAMCIVLAIQQYTGGVTVWAPSTWMHTQWLLVTWIVFACMALFALIGAFTANDKPCIVGHLVQGFLFFSAFFLFTIFCWNEMRLFVSDGEDQTYTTNAWHGQKYRNIRWGMLATHFYYFFLTSWWTARCMINSDIRATFLKNVLVL